MMNTNARRRYHSPPSSVDSSEYPSGQQEVSSLAKKKCTKRSVFDHFWSIRRNMPDEHSDNNQNPVVSKPANIKSQYIAGAEARDADKKASDCCATQRNAKVSNAAAFNQQIVSVSSDGDETPALKRKKVRSWNEPISKGIGRIHHKKIDTSADVNMERAKCTHKVMTQVSPSLRAKDSGWLQPRAKHITINNSERLSSIPKFGEEDNMLKKGTKRFRLLTELYGDKRSLMP